MPTKDRLAKKRARKPEEKRLDEIFGPLADQFVDADMSLNNAAEVLGIYTGERYRQARAIIDRGLDYRFEPKRPVFFSTLKIFQELADEKYGKAYYPPIVPLRHQSG